MKTNTPEKPSSTVVRVTGTSPLSFDLWPGVSLTVKEISPSASNRPTLGGGFKTKGYLLFSGQTKVGRLSPSVVSKLNGNIPLSCKVLKVDKARKLLLVEFV
jgi:hypothetical protein